MTNIHARGIERKMPTGMAWHGMSLKAVYKAIGGEFLRLVTDLNDRCNADNQLLGEGLVFWEKALGLPGTGTLSQRQAAVKQRLGDSGNITAVAITEALHRAGFTNLYAHPNYEYLPLTTKATPMGANTQMGADTQMSYAHIYTNVVDPAIFENFAPFETMGLDTQMGADTQMGYSSEPQEIVVNNLPNDSFSQIPRNPATWTGVFFVCGENKFEVETVAADRKNALRLLLQTIKTFNTAAVLLVEYIFSEFIEISFPSPYSVIYIGDRFTVSGITTNIEDGTNVTLIVVFPDSTEEVWDVTTTEDGEFEFDNLVFLGTYGEGYIELKVAASHATASIITDLALHTITLNSPVEGSEIQIGSTVTISGTTNYADGTQINIVKIIDGAQTTLATPVVENGAFSYDWVSAGLPSDVTFKAWYGYAEDSVNVTLMAVINVIAPAEDDEITVGMPFNVEVETEQEGNVTIYLGSTLIATIPIENGEAVGTAIIPADLLYLGTMFVIRDGQEVPVGDESSISLKFVDAAGFAMVNVTAKLSRDFGIGTETGTAKVSPDIDKNYTLDLFGTLEAAGTSVIGNREIEDKIDVGKLKASAELDHYYSQIDVGGMSARTEPIDHEEEEEFDFGEITFEATVTEGE